MDLSFMNKEKIVGLIDSDTAQEIIANILIDQFKNDPALFFDLEFIKKRSIFHLLVSKNMSMVIEQLLKIPPLRALAFKADKYGQTFLHYACKDIKTDPQLLITLLPHIPEMVNAQDNSGNTPLHLAILCKHQTIVWILVKNIKVNRSLKNHAQKTPFELAADEDEQLKKARLYVDLTQIKLPDLNRYEKPLTPSSERFTDSFPLLSSRHLSGASSSSDSLSSPHLLTPSLAASGSNELSQSDFSLLDEEDSDNERLSAHLLFERLIKAYQQEPTSLEYQEAEQYFFSICRCIDLSKVPNLESLIISTPGNLHLIYKLQTKLYPQILSQYQRIQENKRQLLEQFISLLIRNGLMADSEPYPLPDFTKIAQEPEQCSILEQIWLITAEQIQANLERQPDLRTVNLRTLGLQFSLPFETILQSLRTLFPLFDHHQRLIANFIVWKILYNGDNEDVVSLTQDQLQFKLFKKHNARTGVGLGELGSQLNESLAQLITHHQAYHTNRLFKNYQLLTTWSGFSAFNSVRLSFDNMIEEALASVEKDNTKPKDNAKPKDNTKLKGNAKLKNNIEPKDNITPIAEELKIITKEFYQSVSLQEFNNERNDALNLAAQTKYFNQLNSYFIDKIIGRSPERVLATIKLLLQLAQALFVFGQDIQPDLNHLMLISSILNTTSISRLTKYLDRLSPQEKIIIKELNSLVSKEKNSQWMRKIPAVFKDSLPFPGNILSDIYFAKEGNSSPVSGAEEIGKILVNLLEIKERVKFLPTCSYSNLKEFHQQLPIFDPDLMYYASLRMQSKQSDVIELLCTKDKFLSTLETLNQEYLQNSIIPSVKYQDVVIPSSELGNKLLSLFLTMLPPSNSCPIEEIKLFQDAVKQLEITLKKLNEISRQYQHVNHPEKLNLCYFNIQINQLKQRVSKLIPIEPTTTEASSSETAPQPKTRRNSFFFPLGRLKRDNKVLKEAGSSQTTP